VTKTFYLGVEVLYQDMHSAQSFNNLVPAGTSIGTGSGPSSATNSVKDESNWMVSVRAHRDFLP